jgi:hypothetical protein
MSAFQDESIASEGAMQGGHMDRLIQLEAIADRFLAHYVALRPVCRPRVTLWEAVNILELVLRSWERVKPIRLNYTILMLERQLRAQLTEPELHG